MKILKTTAVVASWLGASIIFGTGTAQADAQSNYADKSYTAICSTIADYPSPGGVLGLVQGVMDDSGFSAYDAGRVVGMAVAEYCPEHLPSVRRFANAYGS